VILPPADPGALDSATPRPQVPHLRTGRLRESAEFGNQDFPKRPVYDTACGKVALAVETTKSPLAVGCVECALAAQLAD
jgi:hypothetical protein